MDDFGFNSMSDEEFRRIFSKILNDRKRELDRFMKMFYSNDFMNPRTGFSGQSRGNDFFKDLFNFPINDMNIDKGADEFGPWENRTWSSPDGMTNYSSYIRTFNEPDFSGFNNKKNDIDTLKLLEHKLNQAIIDEKYEEAAKIRDLINSFKKDGNQE